MPHWSSTSIQRSDPDQSPIQHLSVSTEGVQRGTISATTTTTISYCPMFAQLLLEFLLSNGSRSYWCHAAAQRLWVLLLFEDICSRQPSLSNTHGLVATENNHWFYVIKYKAACLICVSLFVFLHQLPTGVVAYSSILCALLCPVESSVYFKILFHTACTMKVIRFHRPTQAALWLL